MRANYQVPLSAKAVALSESGPYAIIVESPLPEQHESAIRWSATAYVDIGVGAAMKASHKCTDVKRGASSRIRHGHEVTRAAAHGPRRVGRTPLGPIEDRNPERIGRIWIK